ncbi:V-type ATP synthase subunit D [Legionella sp. km772]|uniref:V-type ATP synthase subunit D n=1 Tax=Legionella sp. km772 TaxID=2498111 RepID=UPI000F8E942D|nr:V-type ATP synthase subunit D [Legionella sp. km772]RUR05897.1 V-type ATP synthase subunit D [Legionella sp. km772]
MAQLKLNKASLSLEQKNLKNYQRYLPSLELKRKKLLSEQSNCGEQLMQLKAQEQALRQSAEEHFPMINESIKLLKSLIKVEQVSIEEENIVGVRLPVFKNLKLRIEPYPYLNTPHWFDSLIQHIKELTEFRIRMKLACLRAQRLAKAIQTVTQRKNLFEKVLIPNALKHIRLIQIFLADNERAGVVRSKIAKKKRQLL